MFIVSIKTQIKNGLISTLCMVIICFFAIPQVIASSNTNMASDSVQKEIQISLTGTSKGIDLQTGCTAEISSDLTDFYFIDGKIICLNGAKINAVLMQDANSSLNQVFSPDNLKDSIDARTDLVYTVISPRGYLGVVVLTSVDKSRNVYKGTAISASLDNALKQQIIETSKKGSSNSSDSTGMDTISTGGMDDLSLGGMDSISTGGMDDLSLGGYDYFDTEISSNINKILYEGRQINFKVSPRKYSDGEIFVLLEDIAPVFNIKVTSTVESGIEKVTISKGSKTASLQAYSDKAYVGSKQVKLTKAPKMDNKGILVPLGFLSKNFGIHFTASDDNKILYLSSKSIVQWKYTGYVNKKPYSEYETMYVDGVKTSKTRLNGKKHVFKNVTLYNNKTGKTIKVPENKVNQYKNEWSTTPKSSSTSKGSSSTASSLNAFFTRMNTQRFFQSSSFNTWGGNIIRSMAP